MKLMLPYKEFRRLQQLDKIFKEKEIPFEFKLKYSKTDGYFVIVYGPSEVDFATIAIWPLYKDFNALAEMIEKEMQKE